jgi:hypothetical protein
MISDFRWVSVPRKPLFLGAGGRRDLNLANRCRWSGSSCLPFTDLQQHLHTFLAFNLQFTLKCTVCICLYRYISWYIYIIYIYIYVLYIIYIIMWNTRHVLRLTTWYIKPKTPPCLPRSRHPVPTFTAMLFFARDPLVDPRIANGSSSSLTGARRYTLSPGMYWDYLAWDGLSNQMFITQILGW